MNAENQKASGLQSLPNRRIGVSIKALDMKCLTHPQFAYCLLCLFAVILISISTGRFYELPSLSFQYGHYFLIGLVAAIIANTTGAGGGIVFFPAFILMGVRPEQALATSFAIQCFGMSGGALAWRYRLSTQSAQDFNAREFFHLLFLSSSFCLLTLWMTQYFFPNPPFSVHGLFSIFSIFVGLALFVRIYGVKKRTSKLLQYAHTSMENAHTLNLLPRSVTRDFHGHCQEVETYGSPLVLLTRRWRVALVIMTSIVGGVITAWLSIGVGELLGVLLIALGYSVSFSIALAVTVSALTVLAATPYYLFVNQWIHIDILIFAAPAAAIGGSTAAWLATKLEPQTLKTFVAGWIVLSGTLYAIYYL